MIPLTCMWILFVTVCDQGNSLLFEGNTQLQSCRYAYHLSVFRCNFTYRIADGSNKDTRVKFLTKFTLEGFIGVDEMHIIGRESDVSGQRASVVQQEETQKVKSLSGTVTYIQRQTGYSSATSHIGLVI